MALHSMEEHLRPDRKKFASDPFGYSNLAWMRWAVAQGLAGIDVDPGKPPTRQDLNSPVLWLLQAHALSEAASAVLSSQPEMEYIPVPLKGACDSQYCAAGLMLFSYSLESCLKAMLIVRHGADAYAEEEKRYRHHRLDRLAELIPELTNKDRETLRILSYYAYWAGRYPDPGSGREFEVEEIFSISEKHQVSASELFQVARKVMGQAQKLVGGS